MSRETLMLGLIGTTKNGTNKTEIHFERETGYLQLHQTTGYVIGSLDISSASKLAQSDHRWKVAMALYNLHVDTGKIIA